MARTASVILIIIVAVVVIILGLIVVRALRGIAIPRPSPPSEKTVPPLVSRSVTLSEATPVTLALWKSESAGVYLADVHTIIVPAGTYSSESLSARLTDVILIDKFYPYAYGTGFQVWFDSSTDRRYSIIVKRLNTSAGGNYVVTLDAPPSVITALGIDGVSSRASPSIIQIYMRTLTLLQYRRVS